MRGGSPRATLLPSKPVVGDRRATRRLGSRSRWRRPAATSSTVRGRDPGLSSRRVGVADGSCSGARAPTSTAFRRPTRAVPAPVGTRHPSTPRRRPPSQLVRPCPRRSVRRRGSRRGVVIDPGEWGRRGRATRDVPELESAVVSGAESGSYTPREPGARRPARPPTGTRAEAHRRYLLGASTTSAPPGRPDDRGNRHRGARERPTTSISSDLGTGHGRGRAAARGRIRHGGRRLGIVPLLQRSSASAQHTRYPWNSRCDRGCA